MTVREDYYSASYPPSLWGGGSGGVVWDDKTADFAVAGLDGSAYVTLAALKGDQTYGDGLWEDPVGTPAPAFQPGWYIVLGDSSAATWDGIQWLVTFPAPSPPPPPPDLRHNPPPATATKADLVDWLEAVGVTLSESALMALTKAELVDLVDDIANDIIEPGDVTT